MKQKTIVESFEDLSLEVVEPDAEGPAQASPKLLPSSGPRAREARLPILVQDHSIFAGYPHWGLNE
jgi:hypothetical protein